MRNRRTSLLCLGLLVTGVVIFVWSSIDHAADKLQSTHVQLLNQAITIDSLRLSHATMQLATNHTLSSQLDWNLEHSLQRSLQSQLEPGSLSQLHILDGACRPLLRVTAGNTWAQPVCLHPSSPDKEVAVTYFGMDDHYGYLMVVRQLVRRTQEEPLYIAAVVSLDATWYSNHQLNLDDYRVPSELSQEPVKLSGMQVPITASPVSLQTAIRATVTGFTAKRLALLISYLGITVTLMVLLILNWRFHGQHMHRLLQALSRIANFGGFGAGAASKRPAKDLRGALKQVEQAVMQAKTDNDALSYQIGTLKDKLELVTKAKDELALSLDASIASGDALRLKLQTAQQECSAIGKWRGELSQLSATAREIDALATNDLLTSFDSLSGLFRQWQVGIQSRGARRYLRSLEETQLDNSTLLDAQVQYVLEVQAKCRDSLLNLGVHHRKLLNRLSRLEEPPRQHVNKNEPGHESISLARIVNEVNTSLQAKGVTLKLTTEGWSKVTDGAMNTSNLLEFLCDAINFLANAYRTSSESKIVAQISMRAYQGRQQIVLSVNQANLGAQVETSKIDQSNGLNAAIVLLKQHWPDRKEAIKPLFHLSGTIHGLIIELTPTVQRSKGARTGIGEVQSQSLP